MQGLGPQLASFGVAPLPHQLWLPWSCWPLPLGHLQISLHVPGSENDKGAGGREEGTMKTNKQKLFAF